MSTTFTEPRLHHHSTRASADEPTPKLTVRDFFLFCSQLRLEVFYSMSGGVVTPEETLTIILYALSLVAGATSRLGENGRGP